MLNLRHINKFFGNCNVLRKYSSNKKKQHTQDIFKILNSTYENGSTECDPNWELLSPKGNRFYFPNCIGPAYQSGNTTVPIDEPLENIVEFKKSNSNSKLQFSVSKCPRLIKSSLHELFPVPEVITTEDLCMITLNTNNCPETCDESALKFVIAAKEITNRLRLHGFWSDFMNPFSGKPFYSWSRGKNLYKVDYRFRGIGMSLQKHNDCITITTASDNTFSGSIFSNAPFDCKLLTKLIEDD